MSKIDLGKLWQGILNAAALIGVILVLVQLRQNAELLELQILNQEANNYVELEMAMVGDDYAITWAKMMEEPQSLTLSEARAVESNLWAHDIVRWRNLYNLYERGLLEESGWKQIVGDDVNFELANPYGRAWWEEVRATGSVPEQLAKFIDENLSDAPFNTYTQAYERRMQRVREIQASNSDATVR